MVSGMEAVNSIMYYTFGIYVSVVTMLVLYTCNLARVAVAEYHARKAWEEAVRESEAAHKTKINARPGDVLRLVDRRSDIDGPTGRC